MKKTKFQETAIMTPEIKLHHCGFNDGHKAGAAFEKAIQKIIGSERLTLTPEAKLYQEGYHMGYRAGKASEKPTKRLKICSKRGCHTSFQRELISCPVCKYKKTHPKH